MTQQFSCLTTLPLLPFGERLATVTADPIAFADRMALAVPSLQAYEPLGNSDMERISGLSARALQYAFLQRYQCTPMQWVRDARLDRARIMLTQPEAHVAVLDHAVKHHHVHQVADFGIALGVVQDDEAIGLGHRTEHARALVARGAHLQTTIRRT